MPTRKQAEEAYRRLTKAMEEVRAALRFAEKYEAMDKPASDKWKEESPYQSICALEDRVDALVKGPLVKAVMQDIKYPKRSKR